MFLPLSHEKEILTKMYKSRVRGNLTKFPSLSWNPLMQRGEKPGIWTVVSQVDLHQAI